MTSLRQRTVRENNIELSAVIAASNDLPSLRRCLESLNQQTDKVGVEVLVVSNYLVSAESEIANEFQHIQFINLPSGTSVPQLRTCGVTQAKGDVIALLEDHGTLDDQWCAEIKKAHKLPYAVIGGAIENAGDCRPLDWAVYFYDYGKYMAPNPIGIAKTLPGNNVTYKRSALDKARETFRDGFYETFVNEALKQQGELLYFAPSAIVYHQKTYDLREMIAQFYHHARAYAGKRSEGFAFFKRSIMAAGSPLLPFLLTARIASRTLKKHQHRKELLSCLPHIFTLMTSWASGEFIGYLFGEGESARHWK